MSPSAPAYLQIRVQWPASCRAYWLCADLGPLRCCSRPGQAAWHAGKAGKLFPLCRCVQPGWNGCGEKGRIRNFEGF